MNLMASKIHEAIIKALDTTTYCSAGFSVVMAFLDKHAAGLGVIIAFLSLIVSMFLNNHWKKKHYELEKRKLEILERE